MSEGRDGGLCDRMSVRCSRVMGGRATWPRVSRRTLHQSSSWITDACWIRGQSKLVLSSMDRRIYVYDPHSCDVVRLYVGQRWKALDRQAIAGNKIAWMVCRGCGGGALLRVLCFVLRRGLWPCH